MLLDYPEKEEISHDWAEREYEYVLKMREGKAKRMTV